MEDDPEESAVLVEIMQLRKHGVSLRGIARELNQRAHKTRRQTDWRLESVAQVLNADARECTSK